ncbi:hypothetical protein [Clostridium sp.]|nr:hypothetical protein [Clostridium sp.]
MSLLNLNKEKYSVDAELTCISCVHCVAICPQAELFSPSLGFGT